MMTETGEYSVNQQDRCQKWPDVILIFILSLLPLLFFWRLFAPNPTDRMVIAPGDFTEQYFPLRAFAAQQWVQGEIPLWNPYLYGGQPALADIQSGALYPPHVIEVLLLGWGGSLLGYEIDFSLGALELQVVFHFSVAAVGMYLLVRYLGRMTGISWRGARAGGVIGSLAFTYSGYLTGFPVQQMTILSVSAWLPWVVWSVSVTQFRLGRMLELSSSSWRGLVAPIAWGGLAWAMVILAGHPQMALYIFYLTLAYTLFRALTGWRAANVVGNTVGPWWFLAIHFACWLAIMLLGGILAAAQLIPTLEFIQHSLRADLSYQAVAAGLPLSELISIFYPGYFGGSPEYVGIVTLVLVALALTLGRPRGDIFFWAGAGLFSLLLAFGGNTFAYPLAYLFVPGFESVRQQERIFLVFSFSAAILAGYGAMVLAGPLTRRSRFRFGRLQLGIRIAIVVSFVMMAGYIFGSAMSTVRGDEVNLFAGVLRHHLLALLILAGMAVLFMLRLRWRLWRGGGVVLLALWLIFNLFTVNWRFNLAEQNVEPFGPADVVQFLQTHLSSESGWLAQGRVASGGFFGGGNSAASVHQLQDLTGNTPLQLAAVDNFFRQMPAWRMWQLLNVRYVVDNRDISSAGLSLVFAGDELKVFEIGDPFPRAWFVAAVEVIPDDERAIVRLGSDTFNLRQSAVVRESLAQELSAAGQPTVSVSALTPTYLKADVITPGSRLLVLSQVFYPGWQAKIDGESAVLERVNVIQQGVVIPAGSHTVEVSYRPVTFWLGSAISLLGMALIAALFVLGQTKKPRQVLRGFADNRYRF
jgi:hypothetical protein